MTKKPKQVKGIKAIEKLIIKLKITREGGNGISIANYPDDEEVIQKINELIERINTLISSPITNKRLRR